MLFICLMLPELPRTVCVFKRLSSSCQSTGGIWVHYSSRDGLELCDSAAWGMAEVLLRHFSLSILQLRRETCKLSFRCWKVVVVFKFFSFFFWTMSDLTGGKHSKIYRSKHILLIFILPFSVCRADSRLTRSAPIGTPPFGVMLVCTGGEFDCRSQSLLPSFLSQGEEIQPRISSSTELLTIWWSWAQSFMMLSAPMGT